MHVIPSVSVKHGGPTVALALIVRALAQAGVNVTVATTDDDGPGARLDVPLGQAQNRGGSTRFYFPKQTEFYKVSLPFRSWLKQHASNYDLVHVHALFSYTSTCAARLAAQKDIPIVIRPLGVLKNYGMTRRRPTLKRLSLRFIEKPILRRAAAIHYTSKQEQLEADQLFQQLRLLPSALCPPASFVIPLGLDLAPFQALPSSGAFFERWPQAAGREIVLFVGRLDPIKRLELLIDAFAALKPRRPQILLALAGEGEDSFVRGLRRQAVERGVAGDIIWTGFLEGPLKLSALAAARVFVLPSHSENFGIAAVEALAAGVPTIVTEGVGISDDIRNHDAGLVVAGNPSALADAIDCVLTQPDLARKLSTNGARLAADRFSLPAMGAALKSMYEQVLKKHRRTEAPMPP